MKPTLDHFGPPQIVQNLSIGAQLPHALTDQLLDFLRILARPAGLEPATSWFVARRSIQLS
jgi:hypothetical protein